MIMNCLMAANRKELVCRVITLKPLEDKLRNELDSVLKQCSKKCYISFDLSRVSLQNDI
jgi:hypothetical protein